MDTSYAVTLTVAVPTEHVDGYLVWAPCPEPGDVSRESVYSCEELRTAVLTAGAVVSGFLRRAYGGFRIEARGLYTGRVVGLAQWSVEAYGPARFSLVSDWCACEYGYCEHAYRRARSVVP